ncbi:MAG: SagB family peptide dehydrogenase [Candidatus Xenobia bacterium]
MTPLTNDPEVIRPECATSPGGGDSHNDYLRKHPLQDALSAHANSVEADVHLDHTLFRHRTRLLVGHNRFQAFLHHTDVEQMYLRPLQQKIDANGGTLSGGPITQMIELKSNNLGDAAPLATYHALLPLLQKYQGMLTRYQNGVEIPGQVSVVITGANLDPVRKEMEQAPIRYAALDGSLSDLDRHTSRIAGMLPGACGSTLEPPCFMPNQDIAVALDYHEQTKHSPISVRRSGHRLDFDNQPLPYKVYKDLDPIPLPRDPAPLTMPALDAITRFGDEPEGERIPDLTTLGRLLHHSAGITKVFRYASGRKHYFRAAACTGALYEIDLYVVCGDLADLEAGVYHFGPHDFALRRLRKGDYRRHLEVSAPVAIVCTGTYWRNSWKYQARTYRHFGWDNGTLLANLLADAAANELPARVLMGFLDDTVNRLLDLDTDKEVATCLITIGRGGAEPPAAPELTPLNLQTMPLSRGEDVDYPLMRQMHAASSLLSSQEVDDWRRPSERKAAPLPAPAQASGTIEDVILRRGSSRRFTPEAIDSKQLTTLLNYSTQPFDADFPRLNDLYLILNNVEGSGGASYYQDGSLVPLKQGDFRAEAGFLDLGQELAADAALNVYYMADLKPILSRFGNRGYRAAQMEAGILGGKLYLAAYALGLGATGLTFFDDEVTGFFSPHAADKSTIFLMACGHPPRKSPR